ncbi:MAG: anti-sigma factor [Caulobacteraceae bacterium]
MSDFTDTLPGDADLTAAEYVLGVLDAPERAAAEQRIAAETAFAADVDRWTAILTPMAWAIPALAPPARLWGRVERAVAAEIARRPSAEIIDLGLRRSLALWRTTAASAAAIAAVLLATVMWPHAPVVAPHAAPAQLQPLLVANLQTTTHGPTFVASLDRNTRELVITPAISRPVAGRTPQLWLIPTGGKPISMGLVSFNQPIRLAAGSAVGSAGRLTLAVSIEPLGGSRTGQPTGPVVATGVLTSL